MAPSHSRQLLAWSLPTIAILLSYLWFKKKRIGQQKSDPGDTTTTTKTDNKEENKINIDKEELTDKSINNIGTPQTTPNKRFSRSLSGVDSQPIDIIIPKELKSVKSNPIVISDEDLDLEIEKIKSMRYGGSVDFTKQQIQLQQKQQEEEEQQKQSKEEQPQQQQQENKETPIINNCSTPKQQPIKIEKSTLNMSNKKTNNKSDKNIKVVEERLASFNLDSSSGGMTPKNNLNNGKKSKKYIKNNNNNKLPQLNNISNNNNNHHNKNDELQRQNSDRDSANHSPADVMLASPSLSCISDNHSEGSNDSGKGGSDVATPPPSRTPGTDVVGSIPGSEIPTIYEFIIPQTLVGKLIGKNGSSVSTIKDLTNAQIVVKKHPTNNKMKVCIIEGYQKDIDSALKLIRDKFPLKRYPEMTLEQVSFVTQPTQFPLVTDHLYLKLVEGINNDTIVSCMVSPYHLFLQQPTHPSFPNLNLLTNYMNICYSDTNSPLLPNPIPENTVCVAFSVDTWCRAIILSTDPESQRSYVKFLDYGGYAYVENNLLRQIRGDFLMLPFQAAECFLANVKPIGENTQWPEEAYHFVANLTKGAIIYTQIVDYTEDGIPLVHCYLALGHQLLFLNQELVNQGFGEWITYEDAQQQQLQQQQQQQPEQEQEEQSKQKQLQQPAAEGAVGVTA